MFSECALFLTQVLPAFACTYVLKRSAARCDDEPSPRRRDASNDGNRTSWAIQKNDEMPSGFKSLRPPVLLWLNIASTTLFIVAPLVLGDIAVTVVVQNCRYWIPVAIKLVAYTLGFLVGVRHSRLFRCCHHC
jgi:hypothetical protein